MGGTFLPSVKPGRQQVRRQLFFLSFNEICICIYVTQLASLLKLSQLVF